MLDFCVLYSVFNVHFNSILNTRQSEAIVVLSQPSFRTVSPRLFLASTNFYTKFSFLLKNANRTEFKTLSCASEAFTLSAHSILPQSCGLLPHPPPDRPQSFLYSDFWQAFFAPVPLISPLCQHFFLLLSPTKLGDIKKLNWNWSTG